LNELWMNWLSHLEGRSMSKILMLSAASYLVFQSAESTAASALECPTSIQESSIRLVDTPPDWNTFVASPLYLHGAAPMSGPPEKLGELSDFKQKRGKNDWTYTYQLDGKFPDGKWLACTYGESDQVTLSKKLDDGVQTCAFSYRKGKHVGQNDIAILCK
jgi:hypothetical protein